MRQFLTGWLAGILSAAIGGWFLVGKPYQQCYSARTDLAAKLIDMNKRLDNEEARQGKIEQACSDAYDQCVDGVSRAIIIHARGFNAVQP